MDKQELKNLKENQQEILQTLNNGLKHQVNENGKRLTKMEVNFNKLLFAIGGGLFTIILMLAQLLWGS